MNEFEEVYVREDKTAHKTFSRVGWACVTVLGTASALQLAGAALMGILAPDLLDISWVTMLLTFLPMYLIAFPLGFLIMRPLPAERPEQHNISFERLMAFLLMCFCIMYVGNLIGVGITAGIGALSGSEYENPLYSLLSDWNIYLNILVVVFVAPILEELAFRKFIIDRVRVYGEGTAILVSGLLFGLFHGNLSQFFYAFGLGSIFAYIYLRTGKIQYTMILHAIINFFGGVLSLLIVKWVDLDELTSLNPSDTQALIEFVTKNPMKLIGFGVYAVVVLLAFVAGLILLLENRKRVLILPAEKQLERGMGFKTAFLNSGMIVFALLALALIVYTVI